MANQRVQDIARMIRQCHEGSRNIFSGIKTGDLRYAPVEGMKTPAKMLNPIVFVDHHFLRKISMALNLG